MAAETVSGKVFVDAKTDKGAGVVLEELAALDIGPAFIINTGDLINHQVSSWPTYMKLITTATLPMIRTAQEYWFLPVSAAHHMICRPFIFNSRFPWHSNRLRPRQYLNPVHPFSPRPRRYFVVAFVRN